MTAADALAEGWGIQAVPSPLGSGRINDSYLVQSAAGSAQKPAGRWVLQRINPFVFRKPEVLMDNVVRVSAHLNAKRPGWTLALVPTRAGGSHAELDSGIWRLWSYVGGRSLSKLNNDQQAKAAGRALGQTRRWLQDLPGARLEETIPGHLQLDHHLAEFDAREGADPQLIDFIDVRRSLAGHFRERNGYIHGDGHLDNLIFGADGDVTAVLDLDTVMWGHWAWDFGDLVRSALGCRVLTARFEAVARGYLDTAEVQANAQDLALAPRYVTFMIGVRYLADHLDGDRYFKVSKPGENLQRALDRFRLLEALEKAEPGLTDAAGALVEALGPQDDLNDDDDGHQ